MAKRDIKIHIAADANLAAIREVNNELAKMAMSVGRKNGDLRQATMLAAREYYNLADAADKAATRSVLSAKQIEEAWRKAMTKPTEEAAKGFGKLGEVAKGAAKGIGGAFGQVAGMFLQGGIWGAMSAAVVKAFSWAWGKIKEDAERAAKHAERVWKENLTSIKDGAAAVEKAFDQTNTAIDRAISKYTTMTNSVKELTKAEIELAKQRAIANGMDAASATAAADDLSAQVDYEAERARLEKVIAEEQKRVDAARQAEAATAEIVKKATAAKIAAEAEYQKKREEFAAKAVRSAQIWMSMAQGQNFRGLSEDEIAKERQKALAEFDDSDEAAKAREKIRNAKDALDGIKTDEKTLAAADEARDKIEQAQKALETLDVRREARELAVQNEIAAKVEADHKEQAEKDKAAAEKRAEAERKAAEKAAAERERLDAQEAARRERERQKELADKIRDHQQLLAAERQAESQERSKIAAAESKLQQAWGWYRDKDSMAAQIQEEKADAAARKQFEKDFAKLKDRRRDWRTAENLSVDDEAVRRVALAREEKEVAERHLAEIERNTAALADKLDELLQVKG